MALAQVKANLKRKPFVVDGFQRARGTRSQTCNRGRSLRRAKHRQKSEASALRIGVAETEV